MTAEIVPLDADQFVDGRGRTRDRVVEGWTPAFGTIEVFGKVYAVCGTALAVHDDGGGVYDLAFGFDENGSMVGIGDWRETGRVVEMEGAPRARFDTFREFATAVSTLLPTMIQAAEEALAERRDPDEVAVSFEEAGQGSLTGDLVALAFRLATVFVIDRLIAEEEP